MGCRRTFVLNGLRLECALYRYMLQILLVPLPSVGFYHLCFQRYGEWLPSCKIDGESDDGRYPMRPDLKRRTHMLYYALVFLLIAIVAAVFGFGGVAIASAAIAKILFFVFIVLFLVSLITHMSRRV